MLRNTVSSHVGCNVNYRLPGLVLLGWNEILGGGNKYGGDIFLGHWPSFGRGGNVENNPVAEVEAGFEEEGVMMRYRSMLAR